MKKAFSDRDTELTLYWELVEFPEEKTSLKKFGVDTTKNYRTKIDKCSQCNSRKISKIEVLGAYDGALFWNCEDCLKLHLRFSPAYTEKLLRKARCLWSNPNDWGETGRHEELD